SARHKHDDELRRMNASKKVEGGSIIVSGPVQLEGVRVKATDLRAGAALVVAGLMSNGINEITGLAHIDSGYKRLIEELTNLGAHVWREDMTEEEIAQIHSSCCAVNDRWLNRSNNRTFFLVNGKIH